MSKYSEFSHGIGVYFTYLVFGVLSNNVAVVAEGHFLIPVPLQNKITVTTSNQV